MPSKYLILVQLTAPVTTAQAGELGYRNHEVVAIWENAQNLSSLVIYSHLPHSLPQVYKTKVKYETVFFFSIVKDILFPQRT